MHWSQQGEWGEGWALHAEEESAQRLLQKGTLKIQESESGHRWGWSETGEGAVLTIWEDSTPESNHVLCSMFLFPTLHWFYIYAISLSIYIALVSFLE